MDRADSFVLGLGMGGIMSILFFILVGLEPMNKQLEEHQALITDCEKDKPRSIHCILNAVEKPQ